MNVFRKPFLPIRWWLLLALPFLLAAVVLSSGAHGGSAASAAQGVRVRAWAFAEPAAGDSPVTSLIRSARHLIRLEVYEMTDGDIFAALASARRRHVSVQVLLEQHPYGGDTYAQEAYNRLQSADISVRWANEGAFTYTHEKAIDVDNRTAGIFTFNLSYSGLGANREFGVIDHSGRDAQQIGAIFQSDWNRRRARLTDLGLVVSPINARSALTRLVDRTRHSLDLYEEEMDDPSMEVHLIRAARRGVRVRLLISGDSAGVDRLRSGGVRVEIMSNPYIHAKAIVSDRSRVFIGSENISSTSLDQNREMGIILSQAPAVRLVSNTFSGDWRTSGGGNPPPHFHGKLKVSVSARPRSVSRGQLLTIEARTVSGAGCTIRVTYPDGYVSHAPELLGTRIANAQGVVDWSWHVGSTVTGTGHARVTCVLGKAGASRTVAFTIRS